MSAATKKRFIAGAVCPKCSAMDRIVSFRNDKGEEARECVACGFSDVLRFPAAPQAELETRVNKPMLGDFEPVKLIDPGNK